MKVERILLIEDDEFFAKSFTKKLSKMGEFEIEHAPSVERSISRLKIYEPEVVFLDHELNGVNGVDAIPLLKELLPNTEIVVVSSQRNPEVLGKVLEMNMKYFSKDALLYSKTQSFLEEYNEKPTKFQGFWNSFFKHYQSVPSKL